MKFEDLYKNYNASGYDVTNEEPEMFNYLLGRQTFPVVTGIISGGEMLMGVLLARAQQDMIGIDHSYKSIAVAATKCCLLKTLGAEKFKDMFASIPSEEGYMELLKSAYEQLPDDLKLRVPFNVALYDGTFRSAIRREIMLMSPSMLRAAVNNMDKLTMIHGDLSDVKFEADLLYLSNALEHQTRKYKNPTFATIAPLVKKGGLLLLAVSKGKDPTGEMFDLVKRISAGRGTGYSYELWRRV